MGKKPKKPSFKKVVISPQGRRDITVVAGLRLASALFLGIALIALAHAIGEYLKGEAWAGMVILAVWMAFLACGFAFGEISYGGAAARREEHRIRHRILTRIYHSGILPKNDVSDFNSGRLITLMTDNTERVTEYRQTYYGATMAALLIPFLTLGYVAIAIDAVVGLALMALCPLIPVIVMGFMRLFRKRSAKSRSERAKLSSEYLDAIRNLVTIRLLGAGSRVEERLTTQGEKNRWAIMKLLAGNQVVIIILDGLFSLLLICMACGLSLARYHAGAISVSQALTVVFLSVLLIEPLAQLAGFFYVGMGGMASERAIGKYLTTPLPAGADCADVDTSGLENCALGARGIRFDYGRGEVLHGVNLEVKPGEKVAIVGRSGAGKSTLLSLLRGSLPLQGGQMFIGGRNVRDMSTEELRSMTASVSQSTWLFTGTIADNLRIAKKDATEEEMWEALALAHVDQDIRQMPTGLNTDAGEQGALISGGQAQRISLARAFLSGRKILLLDEPTSQVDIDSEERIIEAISRIGRDYTVIMVTHRKSLLNIADSVWELVDGNLHAFEPQEVK